MKELIVKDMYFAYDTEWILKNINIEIHEHDGCILLTGKNGAGKSTLLNVICGFLPADEGSVERKEMTIGYLPFDHLSQRIDQCSSGQVQKAGIACILLSNADVIIMDEPFIAIDAKSSEKLCEWIQKKKQNQIFLLTSHTTSYICR